MLVKMAVTKPPIYWCIGGTKQRFLFLVMRLWFWWGVQGGEWCIWFSIGLLSLPKETPALDVEIHFHTCLAPSLSITGVTWEFLSLPLSRRTRKNCRIQPSSSNFILDKLNYNLVTFPQLREREFCVFNNEFFGKFETQIFGFILVFMKGVIKTQSIFFLQKLEQRLIY